MLLNCAVESHRRAVVSGRLVIALLPALMLGHDAAADDAVDLDLRVEVIGADIGDLDGLEPFKIDLAGLPLSLGAREGGDKGTPGLMAGITGGYTRPLGSGFSVATSGSLKKTRYLDDVFLGSDSGSGRAAFRFEQGSFRSVVEPGIDIGFFDGEMDTRRYRLNSRVSRDVMPGLDMYLSSALMRRAYIGLPDDEVDSGHAQGGLNYQLNDAARFTFSYDFSHEWAALPQSSKGSVGPKIGIDMSLADALDIGASFRYCRNLSYEVAGDDLLARVDTLQSFGITASWRSPQADYLTVSADYNFERLASPDDIGADDTHDGMVSMALQF